MIDIMTDINLNIGIEALIVIDALCNEEPANCVEEPAIEYGSEELKERQEA